MVEPGQAYVHGWHIEALCDHLEAITNGEISRLLINVPPGTMKSLTVGVLWPAWEWIHFPHYRYVCASHSQDLAMRDSLKMRRLVSSDWYQERWGDKVSLTRDQSAKLRFENMATGFRQAAAAGSITGSRGDRVIIDDPHSVEGASSDAMRQSTIQWFLEAVPTRLNNPDSSAIVVVMQRLHEDDVSGVIIKRDLGYEHLMLPMEFDPSRKCITSIGFEDPREEAGELLFPERFPREVVERDKLVMGSYATAGQYQQTPVPRGGGIIKYEDWNIWDEDEAQEQGISPASGKLRFPDFEYVVASLDTAYTEKQENDFSALSVWGVWRDRTRKRRLMMMGAWAERLELHALVNKVAASCKRFHVDRLLIESKAAGISTAQEIRRLYGREDWSVMLVDPGRGDKVARAYAVQPIFEAGLVYTPDREWSQMVRDQCASFPKGGHDDLVDTVTQALAHLRRVGHAEMPQEAAAEIEDYMRDRGIPPTPLYPV